MIYGSITPAMLDQARDRMPTHVLPGSHRGEEAMLVGALGEVFFEDHLTRKGVYFQRHQQHTRADLVIAGRTFEIKTKERHVEPREYFDCSVPLYNFDHQDVYGYVFTSLWSRREAGDDRFRNAYLLGWCTRDDLLSHGRRFETGQVDPDNGTRFWTACLNIKVSELRGFK